MPDLNTTIWTYWEGVKPPIIQLCLETIQKWNPNFRCLGPEDLEELGAAEVLAPYTSLHITRRSDLLRWWLLKEYGGLWIDADMVCLRPIDLLSFLNETVSLVGVYHTNLAARDNNLVRMVAAPVGATAKSMIAERMFQYCKELCDKSLNGVHIPYGKTSEGVLNASVDSVPKNERKICQQWQYNRISWVRASSTYGSSGTPIQHEFSDAYTPFIQLYHLTNAVWKPLVGSTREELLAGKTFLTYIFNKALQQAPAFYKRALEVASRLATDTETSIVEVGVLRGGNARNILTLRDKCSLLAVDTWDQETGFEDEYRATKDAVAFKSQRELQNNEQAARSALSPFGNRVRFLKGDSSSMASHVTQETFDLVFIDANHSESGVTRDINAWFPLVKQEGYIGGHDYNNEQFPGVTIAVDRFISANNLTLETGKDCTWFTKKT